MMDKLINPASDMVENSGSVNPIVVKRQYLLQQNPFLVGDALDEPGLDIQSVDEFTVQRKHDRIPLYLLLSLVDTKAAKKKRIIKRNFHAWKKEYLEKEAEFLQRVRNQKSATKDRGFKRFSLVTWLIYLFAFLVVLVLFYNYQMFMQTPGFYQFLFKVHVITSTFYGEILLVSLSLFLFLVLVYGIYQNRVLSYLSRKFRASSRQLSGLSEGSKREFRKKYKKALKFYLAKIHNSTLGTYSLDNLIAPKYRFTQMEKLFDLDMENASKFAKNNRMFKVKRFFMHSLSISLALALIAYVSIKMFA